jgi:hypothetical protein
VHGAVPHTYKQHVGFVAPHTCSGVPRVGVRNDEKLASASSPASYSRSVHHPARAAAGSGSRVSSARHLACSMWSQEQTKLWRPRCKANARPALMRPWNCAAVSAINSSQSIVASVAISKKKFSTDAKSRARCDRMRTCQRDGAHDHLVREGLADVARHLPAARQRLHPQHLLPLPALERACNGVRPV